MSFLFATSEVLSEKERRMGRMFRNPVLFWTHIICTLVILIAGAWAFVGLNFGELTRLYVGEVASVWAFGLSWLLAGFHLTAPYRQRSTRATTATTLGGSPRTDVAASG